METKKKTSSRAFIVFGQKLLEPIKNICKPYIASVFRVVKKMLPMDDLLKRSEL